MGRRFHDVTASPGDTSIYTVSYFRSPGSHLILVNAPSIRLSQEATADRGVGRLQGLPMR